MMVPLILLLISVLGMGLTWAMPDVFLLAVLSTLASLVVLAQVWWAGRSHAETVPKWAVIDGSNVMYWQGGAPQLAAVLAVLAELAARGFTAGVIFDANAGYLLEDKYLHDQAFAHRLGLPRDRVMVVPKGAQADGFILTSASDMGAVVVTNDRYRDWATDFPEVATPGRLVRGGFRDGVLWLDMGLC